MIGGVKNIATIDDNTTIQPFQNTYSRRYYCENLKTPFPPLENNIVYILPAILISIMRSIKTVSIALDTHKRLQKHGNYGDTMNDIIIRLLDIAEKKKGGKNKIKRK